MAIFDTRNNKLIVCQEDRASRKKYAGGTNYSSSILAEKIDLNSIDHAWVSSCCEPQCNDKFIKLADRKIPCTTVNHHLSHAWLTYRGSLFEDALIVIADAGGNMLEPFRASIGDNWWDYKREQLSIFEAKGQVIEKIEDYFSNPNQIGAGEFWRYMTYACGFQSSSQASKTMEYASFASEYPKEVFFDLDEISSPHSVKNVPPDKQMLGFKIYNLSTGMSLGADSTNADQHKCAAWAQHNLQELFRSILSKHKNKHQNLCLAGGVALNCKLISFIQHLGFFDNVYVSYAPSDKGQALGNLVLGLNTSSKPIATNVTSPFLGVCRSHSISKIRESLGGDSRYYLVVEDYDAKLVYQLLLLNYVVATFCGRGEVGERALGNTSILTRIENPNGRKLLNDMKKRPNYTPVAPAVHLGSKFGKEIQKTNKLKFMNSLNQQMDNFLTFTEQAKHIDGSVRPQLFEIGDGSFFGKLSRLEDFDIEEAYLNTSFNGVGEAMPESIEDALKTLSQLKLELLYTGQGYLVRRKCALREFQINKIKDPSACFTVKEIINNRTDIETRFLAIKFRERYSLFDNYVDWLKSGRKVTTIRFEESSISLPSAEHLPLVTTKDFRQSAFPLSDHTVSVHGVKLKKFGELDLFDAQRDGFESTSNLKSTLKTIYPNIEDKSYVSINYISIAD